ncbi:MAG TPA: transaldolase family protein [Polyangiaceae bacterium]|jgi:transaldolase|nr:transaldolase family protein [Polyangiaceae bacterium]
MIFLDSSDPKEIKDISAWGVLSGITTNPLIISKEAGNVDLEKRIKEIIEVSRGDVSVELTTENEKAMLEEAAKYHAWNPQRVCIKVPFSEIGMRVLHQLASRGVHTNVTCLMSFNQAYLASLAGATYVSLFSGRVRDMGYDVRPVIQETRNILDRESLASKIIVGSVRHLMDVNEALQCGAHILTVPPAILRKMLWNPRTEETIREFNTAWANRGK